MNTKIFTYAVVSLGLFVGLAQTQYVAADGPAIPAGTAAPITSGSSGGMFGGSPGQPGGIMAFAPLVLMFGVFYFLILRPQQKKMKAQQDMLVALKHGDYR
jgi:hypothetical protein